MASLISRTLLRTPKCRPYSVQAAQRAQEMDGGIKVSTVNGIKVVTAEENNPVSLLSVMFQAGARHEDTSNIGITHYMRHAVELGDDDSMTNVLVRSIDGVPCNFKIRVTRDYAFYNTSFLPGKLPFVMESLNPLVMKKSYSKSGWAKSKPEIVSRMMMENELLCQQPNAKVVELLHEAAYRGGLGNSLFAPPTMESSYTPEQMINFMGTHYQSGRTAYVGIGIEHDELVRMAQLTPFPEQVGKPHDVKSVYRGGEARENRAAPVVFSAIATEGPSLTGKDLVPASILAQIIGTGNTSIKYQAKETGGKMVQALSGVSDSCQVSGFCANYTDSGLFGFIAAAKPADIEAVLKKCVETMADITKTGLKDEEVLRGKNLLLSTVLSKMENVENVLEANAEQALVSDKITNQAKTLKMIQDIKTEEIVNVAKKLINGKPSMASVGLLQSTPYLDDLFK